MAEAESNVKVGEVPSTLCRYKAFCATEMASAALSRHSSKSVRGQDISSIGVQDFSITTIGQQESVVTTRGHTPVYADSDGARKMIANIIEIRRGRFMDRAQYYILVRWKSRPRCLPRFHFIIIGENSRKIVEEKRGKGS